MTPDNWRRVDKIYDEVLGKPAEEREQFLDRACADDPPEVRDSVEKLLRSPHEDDGGLFNDVRALVGTVLLREPPPAIDGRLSEAERLPDFGAVDKVPPRIPGYETLMLIDEGGMGVVWRVRDLQFERSLAIKVMKAAWSEDSHRVCRFFAEARITAQLAHPSIVPVHALGLLADGRPYYTMKLVKGDTLADLLKAGPDVASRRMEFLQVFARVCQALAFAHKEGVIHLDLKPSNVMVGEHGGVQVMDWGLAKMLAESDDRPGVAGTWPYMPPEQANGRIEEVERRSDVFGLGAMLCAILTGEPPYVGPTPEDVKRQAREADLADAYARLGRAERTPS